IETRLLEIDTVENAVVIALKRENETFLCAYVVSGKELPVSDLRQQLSRTMPDYMIPSFIVKMEKFPLASTGKIDRKALPEPGLESTAPTVAPRNPMEERLATIWAGVLKTKKYDTEIGIDDNFFLLGGHSLKATILVSKIHKEMEVSIPVAEIFKHPTIRGMANTIAKTRKTRFETIPTVANREYYPQSSAQKRLYFLDRFENIGTGYNMSALFKIIGSLDKALFEKVFRKLIRRPEVLRTSFHEINAQPVQKIHETVTFEVDYFNETKKTGDLKDG
ncbi:MAG: non-ribosomal peptide synthetase, partial [bacterium]|nr:non-ribosomal peptide synthetase [bacterium]